MSKLGAAAAEQASCAWTMCEREKERNEGVELVCFLQIRTELSRAETFSWTTRGLNEVESTFLLSSPKNRASRQLFFSYHLFQLDKLENLRFCLGARFLYLKLGLSRQKAVLWRPWQLSLSPALFHSFRPRNFYSRRHIPLSCLKVLESSLGVRSLRPYLPWRTWR